MRIKDWNVVIKSAIRHDGTALFPERLPLHVLEQKRRVMGSYIFSNQYLNEIIPLDDQTFKKHWFRNYKQVPFNRHNYIFVDPAISKKKDSDFTAIVVVSVDEEQNAYVQVAQRARLNPTETIEAIFKYAKLYMPLAIGIEQVAYQEALIHFCHEEMTRRGEWIPVRGVTRGGGESKQSRILSLVPRYEYGKILHAQGLDDLEMELLRFPRSSHDDISDALASVFELVVYPNKVGDRNARPNPSNANEYEKWYIRSLSNPRSQESEPGEY